MPDVHVVILAAGKGTRMKSSLPKVLHNLAGQRLLEYALRTAEELSPQSLTLVLGHMAETIKQAVAGRRGVQVVVQEPQLGTGHALLQAASVLKNASGALLLLSADVPLLKAETLRRLCLAHERALPR